MPPHFQSFCCIFLQGRALYAPHSLFPAYSVQCTPRPHSPWLAVTGILAQVTDVNTVQQQTTVAMETLKGGFHVAFLLNCI